MHYYLLKKIASETPDRFYYCSIYSRLEPRNIIIKRGYLQSGAELNDISYDEIKNEICFRNMKKSFSVFGYRNLTRHDSSLIERIISYEAGPLAIGYKKAVNGMQISNRKINKFIDLI